VIHASRAQRVLQVNLCRWFDQGRVADIGRYWNSRVPG
jgi:hypothetical protein